MARFLSSLGWIMLLGFAGMLSAVVIAGQSSAWPWVLAGGVLAVPSGTLLLLAGRQRRMAGGSTGLASRRLHGRPAGMLVLEGSAALVFGLGLVWAILAVAQGFLDVRSQGGMGPAATWASFLVWGLPMALGLLFGAVAMIGGMLRAALGVGLLLSAAGERRAGRGGTPPNV